MAIQKFPEHKTFPGLEIRRADCGAYNAGKRAEEYRQLHYYRLVGDVSRREPNLHAAAHLYASDRNGLFLISNAVGFADRLAKIASLGHSVIFHTDAEGMLLEGNGWWTQEAWTPRSGGGRGVHESKLWSPNGVDVATTLQDGLVTKAEPGMQAMFEGFGEVFKGGDVEEGEKEMFKKRETDKEGRSYRADCTLRGG
jgi:acyl-CoA thioesterase